MNEMVRKRWQDWNISYVAQVWPSQNQRDLTRVKMNITAKRLAVKPTMRLASRLTKSLNRTLQQSHHPGASHAATGPAGATSAAFANAGSGHDTYPAARTDRRTNR